MSLISRFLDLLFPPLCPFCHELLEEPGQPVCSRCQSTLPWLTGDNAHLSVELSDGCFSPLAYTSSVSKAVHRYKFSRVRACAAPFGLLMAQCAQDSLPIPADAVTWVPLSRTRLRKRGFDQAELLAREVAARLNLPVLDTLEKRWDTPPQSTLTDVAARRANALGAYFPRPDLDLKGLRLLLVDDVVTSGATLSECARLLLQSGAEQVWCLTLAQAGQKARIAPECAQKL